MDIIKENPFRILGLTANATEREFQKQLSKIKAYERVGKEVKLDYDFEFLGNLNRNASVIQNASNQIEQDYKKVIYSLFWFVNNSKYDEIAFENLKENDTEKAIEIWNKTLKDEINSKNYTSYLNLSTLFIALSTITEHIDLQILQAGISLKAQTINSDCFQEFLRIITGNGLVNDRNEISIKFVDQVIELIKPKLDKENGISTNDLISIFNSFPNIIQKYTLSKFSEIPISRIENLIEKTSIKRKEKQGEADKFGEELFKTTENDLSYLKNILGTSNVKYQMLADKLANELLQCSVAYFNEREYNTQDNDFKTVLNTAKQLVKLAELVAISIQVKDKAKENFKTLEEMKNIEIVQAINLLKSIKDTFERNKDNIMHQIRIQEASLGFGQTINWEKVNEYINNSLDWDKVVEMVLDEIPIENMEIIEKNDDINQTNEYRSLVEFLFNKLSYSQKNKLKYLAYWQSSENNYTLVIIVAIVFLGIVGASFAGFGGFVLGVLIGIMLKYAIFNIFNN